MKIQTKSFQRNPPSLVLINEQISDKPGPRRDKINNKSVGSVKLVLLSGEIVEPKLEARSESSSSNLTTKLNFIEVCSGAGGLSSGFISSGFVPIFLNDSDKTCCETLEPNHPDVNVIQQSMTDIDLNEYLDKDIDLLMGGVPCQSFSQAGKKRGLNDVRGSLIIHFIEMVSLLKPKVFMIENVKGLKTHNKGETFKHVLGKINQLDYKTEWKILNANDYGVPQKRERMFIVGIRNDIQKRYLYPNPEKYKPVLRDVLLNCPESEGYKYKEKKYKVMDLVPEGGCWVDLPVEIQKEYMMKSYYTSGGKRGMAKRLAMNKPSVTLMTSPCQKQTERCHPTKTRPLQILEYSRIQTFPDDYKFCGSLTKKYKQISNAVS